MTLTRTTRGLDSGFRDDFDADTSAEYDLYSTQTITMAGGLATLVSSSTRSIRKNHGTIMCATARGLRAGSRMAGVLMSPNSVFNVGADIDCYISHWASTWRLDRLDNNSTTALASSSVDIPVDGDYGLTRIILLPTGVVAKCGRAAFTRTLTSTDLTYPGPCYAGLCGGSAAGLQVDWHEGRPSHLVTVTGLPANSSVVCSDGATPSSPANTAAGVAVADCGAVLFPLASIDVYSQPNGAGVLIDQITNATLNDMGGGDVLARSAAAYYQRLIYGR